MTENPKEQTAGWAVLAMLCAAQFVMVLDTTVMNLSISQIVADLNTTVVGLQTAITVYTLVMAAFMLIGGKLGDRWGARLVFAAETVVVLGLMLFLKAIPATRGKPGKLDLPGAALSAAGLGGLVFGILRSSQWGWVTPSPSVPAINGTPPTPLGLSPVFGSSCPDSHLPALPFLRCYHWSTSTGFQQRRARASRMTYLHGLVQTS